MSIIDDIGESFSDAGDWIVGAANTAGSAAGDVVDWTGGAIETVGEGIGSIPVLGDLLGVVWSGATSPVAIAKNIANGVPIDQVALKAFERELANIKKAAPYAQTVISFVPGIGPVASGAISAGIAMANGQPIDEILIAGAKGAIPGGPLAAAAFEASVGAIQGKSIEEIGIGTVSNLGQAVGVKLPEDAERYLAAGLQVAKGVAQGENVQTAIVSEAIEQLPPQARDAAKAAQQVSNGAALSDILLENGLNRASERVSAQFGAERFTAKALNKTTVNRMVSRDQTNKMLQGDRLGAHTVSYTAAAKRKNEIRKAMKDAIQAGIAMGSGAYYQKEMARRSPGMFGLLNDMGARITEANEVLKAGAKAMTKPKLVSRGRVTYSPSGVPQDFADSDFPYGNTTWQETQGFAGDFGLDEFAKPKPKLVSSGRKIVPKNSFNIGAAMMKAKINPTMLASVRAALPPDTRSGFDTAVSISKGQLYGGAEGMTPEQAAGYYATTGMLGASPDMKQGIVEGLIEDSDAKEGVKQALTELDENLSLWERILRFFGLR